MILVRAEYSPTSGFGHVARSLVIFNELKNRNSDVSFIAQPRLARRLIESGLSEYDIFEINCDSRDEINHIPSGAVLLLDIFSSERLMNEFFELEQYILNARNRGILVIVIDGYGDDSFSGRSKIYLDVLIQPYYGADQMKDSSCGLALRGGEYALVDPEFHKLKKERNSAFGFPLNILVSLGAADPQGNTEKVVSALTKIDLEGILVSVIIGPDFSKEHIQRLNNIVEDRVNFVVDHAPRNLFGHFKKATLLITGSGNSRYEAVAGGLPLIFGAISSAHVGLSISFSQHTGAFYLGEFDLVDDVGMKEILENVIPAMLTNGHETSYKAPVLESGASLICDSIQEFLGGDFAH